MTDYHYDGHDNIPNLPYVASAELVEAVNLALFLKRPLLLRGEPGCGKTLLARHVAASLGLGYQVWPIKSTSRARDGLYYYDAIGRLRDAQFMHANLMSREQAELAGQPDRYIRWGPLGTAFRAKTPSIVLIDEIDKADIDFPNDLLHEMELLQEPEVDKRRLLVEEIGHIEQIRAEPFIFITSNDEKSLPDAFLRRCLFHYIRFPKEDVLLRIVKSHFAELSKEIVEAAVRTFQGERDKMNDKKASTSELIDWIRVLTRYPESAGGRAPTATEVLARLRSGELAYASVLIKGINDHLEWRER